MSGKAANDKERLMIIWGWKGREIVQGYGQFHCPQCRTQTEYQEIRVATYFTLYFVPLWETEHHGNYIQCLDCQQQYRPEVLHASPASAKRKRHRTRRR
jgi:hypothetical protein